MKVAIIFLALFATCAAFDMGQVTEQIIGQVKAVRQQFEGVLALWKKCVTDKNLSAKAIMNLIMKEGQDDQETNCARACFMKETGVMADKKINIAKVEEGANASPWLQAHPLIKDTILRVFKRCSKTAESAANECEMAGKLSKCCKDITNRIIADSVKAFWSIVANATATGA